LRAVNLKLVRARVLTTLPAHQETLLAAQREEPALAGCASVEELTARLTRPRGNEEEAEERMRMVLALLRGYQRSQHALWSGALLLAFLPMLARLRRRMHCPLGLHDEAEQIVLDAFYVEAARVNVAGFGTFPVLRRAVVRAAFGVAKAWRRDSGVEGGGEIEEAVVPDLDLFIDMTRAVVDVALLDTAGVALSAQVDFAHDNVTDLERHRIYERVKRQRSRERARHRHVLSLAA
jgi:hypothetical protein